MTLRALVVIGGLLCAQGARAQQCLDQDTGIAENDCDNDGSTIADGDCDDEDSTVHPGRNEICADQKDNNCNGLFDEECDRRPQLGSIRGGGGCTGGAGVGGTAFLLFLPLAFWRREDPA